MTSEHLEELISFTEELRKLTQIEGLFYKPVNSIYDKVRKDIPEGLHIEDYPAQYNIIAVARESLFLLYPSKQIFLNPLSIGKIIASLDAIIAEESQPSAWNCVHPRIQISAKKLFLDGHYANAAEDAFIEIGSRVKDLLIKNHPGEPVSDGVSLMQKTFSGSDMVVLAEQSSQTGRDIQDGFRFLFAGSMAAFRNPKAHSNQVTISPQESMRRIMFASSLMYKLDEVEGV